MGIWKNETVRCAHTEVVLAHGAAGGKNSAWRVGRDDRCRQLRLRQSAGHRNKTVNGGPVVKVVMVQELPAFGERLAQWLEEANAIQGGHDAMLLPLERELKTGRECGAVFDDHGIRRGPKSFPAGFTVRV